MNTAWFTEWLASPDCKLAVGQLRDSEIRIADLKKTRDYRLGEVMERQRRSYHVTLEICYLEGYSSSMPNPHFRPHCIVVWRSSFHEYLGVLYCEDRVHLQKGRSWQSWPHLPLDVLTLSPKRRKRTKQTKRSRSAWESYKKVNLARNVFCISLECGIKLLCPCLEHTCRKGEGS